MLMSLIVLGASLAAGPQGPAPPAPAPSVVIRRSGEAVGAIGVGQVAYLSPPEGHALGQMILIEGPGYRTPIHVHHHLDESFYVLSGRLTLHAGGQTQVLGPGDYVFIPRGVPHAQGNQGSEATHLLMSVSSGDFLGFFRAREDLVKTSPPGHPDYGPRMHALSDIYDVENLGDPPF
ncbi:cupin domain-containing protein [Brevundimonas guildfordensis]|uniref:Cupin domain-containing protein n=1 Tax=Brevundimonas guildfordensis TaxID=2762241 RepID=A0ABR8R0E4_9CAUL|nr:cupin domain-containing protein [Brevundimonas guildfordensis]MBD7941258.1 cupin domain-containing protein [Brevundimonas guildfordensis]